MNTLRNTIADAIERGAAAAGRWLAGLVRPTDGGPRPTIPK